MGKNNSTTKGGKYMNPADRARKDARKRELKKNKKQRQLVRETILKQRDAFKLLEELESLDKTLYDPVNRPKLHENVLREKRRKLKSDFDRVLRFYAKENPELASDIRKAEGEYERRRSRLEQLFDQVKYAERVQLDEIPLPSELPPIEGSEPTLPTPAVSGSPQKSILKSRQAAAGVSTTLNTALSELLRGRKLPGPPPGPPPELPDVTDEELERAESSRSGKTAGSATRRSRFDTDSKEGSESQVDARNEDTDAVHSSTKRLRFVDDADALPTVIEGTDEDNEAKQSDADTARRQEMESGPSAVPPRFSAPPMPFPGSFMTPFSRPPPPMGPGVPPPSRFGPGPPGSMRFAMHHGLAPPPPGMHMRMAASATVSYSAPPSIARQPTPASSTQQTMQPATGNVVEAKPQMKNLRTDVVRFVPTNLQIRRDDGAQKGRINMRRTTTETANYLMPNVPPSSSSNPLPSSSVQPITPNPTAGKDEYRRGNVGEKKDDAYEKFMREISGLL